jgi:glycosyltransferase involved in cell wall biosynthesis
MSPRVSVVTPAHNSEEFLGEALRSIEAQSYEDWEVVVADDASTDRTAEVAKEFGPRVTVVRSERNVGPAGARNLALDHARGELVALLDADDYFLPGFLETQVGLYDAASAEGARVGLVTCNARILGPEGMSSVTYHDLHRMTGELSLERLLERNPVFVSSLFPRRLIDEVGPFDTDIRGAEDFDLWVRIMERGYRALVTSEPLAVYRRWPGALTSSQATSARSERLAYERALGRGRLDARQARIARRRLRHSRAVELIAGAFSGPAPTRRAARRRMVGGLPLILRVGLENPRDWGIWVRGAASLLFRGTRREYAR